ncbi:helix-turn-helix domain-containing protein [Thermodesulforhabdus norvegica]|uniref:Transcriptional regulator, XRE family with cupin sensor n=1 Tax=Thermodesulforhabdus norvegica TaxID=39841 RepID=A0A1I4VQM9_9BACT|nr:XRE family transcriptional regulator [Thermodesulforhabdus norvegica]SFN03602.1 transcriptional regulator, XRE family with cupin sensor [Thermodesulforhabdus norvegica]
MDREDLTLAVRALQIGNKVRELREKQHYTLQDLSAKTGLSKALLSQIENNRVIPPIATLLRLAKALNVGLSYFFQDEVKGETVYITRLNERIRVDRRAHHREGEVDYVYEALETKKHDKHMEPFYVEFPPLETSDMVFTSHEGEEFVYVMEGTLEFRTADRVERLEAGDCIYFDSSQGHSFRSLEDRPAKAIVVVWTKRL